MRSLKFSLWVKNFGIQKLADKCEVGPHQVRQWLRGKAAPRAERLVLIVELSKNKFSIEELIAETTRAKS